MLGAHMEFLAAGLGGDFPFGSEQTVWRSYVVGLLAFVVTPFGYWSSRSTCYRS